MFKLKIIYYPTSVYRSICNTFTCTFLSCRFISILALYLVVGFAFQVGVRKKRGVESIPNSEFWTGLPSTIKVSFFLQPETHRFIKQYFINDELHKCTFLKIS